MTMSTAHAPPEHGGDGRTSRQVKLHALARRRAGLISARRLGELLGLLLALLERSPPRRAVARLHARERNPCGMGNPLLGVQPQR